MRDRGGRLLFDPRPSLERLRVALTVRGQRLEVCIEKSTVTHLLRGTADLTVEHRGEALTLLDGEAVTRELEQAPEATEGPHDRVPMASQDGAKELT